MRITQISLKSNVTAAARPRIGYTLYFATYTRYDLAAEQQRNFSAHTTSADHVTHPAKFKHNQLYTNTGESTRSHSVTIPSLGAFAGLSVRYPNARVSFGYRADFFFGAMDVGIDTRKSTTTGFHGPFAKLSIGLGG